jgi:drug/metabolite transporter (DMT)-like permease
MTAGTIGSASARASSGGARVPSLALLATLGVLWGVTFPVVRMGVAAGAAPFALLAVDLALAAGVMALLASVLPGRRPTARSLGGSALLGFLLIGVNNALLFWGIEYTTGGVAAVVYATVPLLAVLSALTLGFGGRIGAARAVALALGLLGVVVLDLAAAGTGLVTNVWGIAAILGGASAQAVGTVLVGRFRPAGETGFGRAAQFAGGGFAAALAIVLVREPLVVPATATIAVSVLYFALLSAVAGYTLFFELVRRSGAVSANLVTYVSPMAALLVGVLLLGERFGFSEVAGLALILGALALYEFLSRDRRSAEIGRPRPLRPIGLSPGAIPEQRSSAAAPSVGR